MTLEYNKKSPNINLNLPKANKKKVEQVSTIRWPKKKVY